MSVLTQNSILRISDEKTLQLIDLYQKEECLWNTHSDHYKDRYERIKAAERIAKALAVKDFGPRNVMTKFKNLRNSYNQELKKIAHSLASGVEEEELYRPKVCWFSKMDSFLRPYVQQARTRPLLHDIQMEDVMLDITENNNEENDFKITEEEESTDSLKQEPEIDLFEAHEDNIQIDANKEEPYYNENDEELLKNDKKRIRKSLRNAKRSKSDDNEINQSIRGFMKSKQSRTQIEDCYDTFGKYIAALLRSLPPQRALELQPKIVSLIVSAGLGFHEARISQSDEGID